MWKLAENRRRFFENFAKTNGFDPLIAEAWYSQPSEKILSAKVHVFLSLFLFYISFFLCVYL
jgi:hypothetical protein